MGKADMQRREIEQTGALALGAEIKVRTHLALEAAAFDAAVASIAHNTWVLLGRRALVFRDWWARVGAATTRRLGFGISLGC